MPQFEITLIRVTEDALVYTIQAATTEAAVAQATQDAAAEDPRALARTRRTRWSPTGTQIDVREVIALGPDQRPRDTV